MRTILLTLASAAVMAVLAASCGGTNNLCESKNVRCEDPLQCDPEDGLCKCGGAGGTVCQTGFACDTATNTCLSSRCAGVSCASRPGTSCDMLDGICKCGGTGGQLCEDEQVCNPTTKQCQPKADCSEVACGTNQNCDPDTGLCMCGQGFCEAGHTCAIAPDGSRLCVEDRCTGVNCLGGTSCDPADGTCKCNGVACTAGQVCDCPSGTCAEAERTCVSGSACAAVTCTGSTTCDPADGQCKCGGPGGAVCGAGQVCNLMTGQCQGGNQCMTADGGTKVCPGQTSCDPEDGLCKCGGRGGQVCGDGTGGTVVEVCVVTTFSISCEEACNPTLQLCSKPGEYCYFNTLAKVPVAYCAVNSDTRIEGQGCANPTACFTTNPTAKGLHCLGLGTFDTPGGSGFCRSYCDTTAGTAGCPQGQVAQTCEPIVGAGPGIGFCKPVGS
jgi:hypothetical protein